MNRPTWDEYWIKIINDAKTRSTCIRRQVGAVIVKNNQILAMGYNGAPSGLPHCNQTGCLREKMNIPSGERAEICRAIHAEQNAIIQAAKHGVSIDNSTIYITSSPCNICAKMLINAGIKEIIFQEKYPDKMAHILLSSAGYDLIEKDKLSRYRKV